MSPALAHDSAFFRRLAYLGAHHGPEFWLKYSPTVFGAAFACALPKARKRVSEQLRAVRGPVDAWRDRREVLETFVSYAHCLAEALAAERPKRSEPQMRRSGVDHLLSALERGQGAIVVTAHVGPWDAAARLLRRYTPLDVVVAMAREPNAAARRLHDGVRERSGVRIAHLGEHPLDALPLLSHLKEGGIVAAQLDRGAPSGRVLAVDAFGEFQVPEGPFRLGALAGAPIVPMFARRRGHFDYEVVVSPAIYLPRNADLPCLREAAQQATTAMTDFIRQSPTQWFRF